jgi:CRISPR-associated protein Csy2
MAECPHFDQLLVIPHLRIQNANAVSSPMTHGFPSITAFLGLMWALERKTVAAALDLQFNAVGVVCHDHQEQVTQGGFVNAFCLTRNPVGRDGGTAAIVEEGRIHLEVTLIFAVQSASLLARPDKEKEEALALQIAEILKGMRIAGGSVVLSKAPAYRQRPYFVALTGSEHGQQINFNRVRMRWLPGAALVCRDDLLEQRHQVLLKQDEKTSKLDAWLSLSRINWRVDEKAAETARDKTPWTNDRKGGGWIVPIPVGYGALGDVQAPGSVSNARDASTPFRFVESLYSVGEWISPHRLQSPQQLLWYADSQPDNGLYRCRNDYAATSQYDFD